MEKHANSHEEAPEDSLDVEPPPSVHDGEQSRWQSRADECRRVQTSAECRMQTAQTSSTSQRPKPVIPAEN